MNKLEKQLIDWHIIKNKIKDYEYNQRLSISKEYQAVEIVLYVEKYERLYGIKYNSENKPNTKLKGGNK